MKFNALKTTNKSTMKAQREIKATIGDVNKLLRITSHDIYSHPLRTGIQEYLSNAKDAHTESGVCLSKMIIEAPTLAHQVIKIRDFGAGLSEAEVQDYFLSFASSTKDKSNDSIGGFGLGSKSWIAVMPVFSMISIKDGVKTIYQIERDEETYIKGKVLAQEKTTEPSGVELHLPIKSKEQIMDSKDYINRVIKYWDKEPQVKNMTVEKLETEIKKDTYSFYQLSDSRVDASYGRKQSQIGLTLGGIEYSLDHLSNSGEIKKMLEGLDICLHFNVGEIVVSPNRETITNSEEACKLVLNRAKEVYKELTEYYLKDLKKKSLSYIVKNRGNTFLKRILEENKISKGSFSYKIDSNRYYRGTAYSIFKGNSDEPLNISASSTMFVLKNRKLTKADNIVQKIELIDVIVVNDKELKDKDLRFTVESVATNNDIVGNSRGNTYTGLALVPNGFFSEKELKDLQPQHKVYKISEIEKKCTKERQSHEKKDLNTTIISLYFSVKEQGRGSKRFNRLDKSKTRITTVSNYNNSEDFKCLVQGSYMRDWSDISGIEYIVVSNDYYKFLEEQGFKPFDESTIQKEIKALIKKHDFLKTYVMSEFLERNFNEKTCGWSKTGPQVVAERMSDARKHLDNCRQKGLVHPVFEQISKVLGESYLGTRFEKSEALINLIPQTPVKLKTLSKYIEKDCKKYEKELKLKNMKDCISANPLMFSIFNEFILNETNYNRLDEVKLREFSRMMNVSKEDYQG